MPKQKTNAAERNAVLKLLRYWHNKTMEIEQATGRMQTIAGDPSLGIQSVEYEKARVAAMAVVDAIGREGAEAGFWPELGNRQGQALLATFRQQWNQAIVCQLSVLRVWGVAAAAFRNKRENDAPPIEELMSLAGEFAGCLDELGRIGTALALHYKISAAELEKEV